jgi:hypothetical protein
MSKGELNDLEREINRYLDGNISDDEFERFLVDRSESIDIERLRSFRSRVERIEELYRQIDEPAVPDGYWESFADRVAERLPDTVSVTVWDKILNYVLPWRWPVAAYSYAGAVASVLLIFFIGKIVQESREDVFAPKPVESAYRKYDLDLEDGKTIEHDSRSAVTDRSRGAGEKGLEDKEEAVPSSIATVDVNKRQRINFKDASPEPKGRMVEPISDEVGGTVELESPAGKLLTEVEELTGQVGMPEIADEAAPTVEIIEPDEEFEIAEPVEVIDDVSLVFLEPQHIEPVAQEKPVLAKIGESRQVDQLSRKSITASGYTVSTSVEGTVWKYDNWNLDDLREELKLYETILSDSSYSSTIFKEYAGMKSSVAILTRDSIDVYDAVNTIDTLLIHNPEIDRRLWLQRRSNLRSIVPIRTNP